MISTAKLPSLVALASLGLSACASQGVDLAGGPIAPTVTPAIETGSTSVQSAENKNAQTNGSETKVAETVSRLPSGYQLTPEELELPCKKLTGRMAVRIVQIRDFQKRTQASYLARSIQTATKPLYGGKGEGTDPDGRYARDVAILEAYNRRLAEKKCPDFDLEKELAPGATELPRTRPVKKS